MYKLIYKVIYKLLIQKWVHARLKKETPTQVLSSEYWEIFQNTYFKEHLGKLLLHGQQSLKEIVYDSFNNLKNDTLTVCL